MAKQIPFLKSSDGPKSAADIVEEGTLGQLHFQVYKRGTGDVIHIFTKDQSLNFKKDCSLFESEVKKLNLETMKDGDIVAIKASGANDSLVFSCNGDDVKIELEKPSYPMVERLRNLLRGKKHK